MSDMFELAKQYDAKQATGSSNANNDMFELAKQHDYKNAPEVGTLQNRFNNVWDLFKLATGNISPTSNVSPEGQDEVKFLNDIANYTIQNDFLGGEEDAHANIIETQSGGRYKKIVRPVPQEEKDNLWTPAGLVADNEILIQDTKTGEVISLNKPGFGIRDVVQMTSSVAPEIGWEILKTQVPFIRGVSKFPTIDALTSAAGFGGINYAQQQMRQARGSGEETNLGETAIAAGLGGAGAWVDRYGRYSLPDWMGGQWVGDKLTDMGDAVASTINKAGEPVRQILSNSRDFLGKTFNVDIPNNNLTGYTSPNTINSLAALNKAYDQGGDPNIGNLSVGEFRRAEREAQKRLEAMGIGVPTQPDNNLNNTAMLGYPRTPAELANRANPDSPQTAQLIRQEAALESTDPEIFKDFRNARLYSTQKQLKEGLFTDVHNSKIATYNKEIEAIDEQIKNAVNEQDKEMLLKRKKHLEDQRDEAINLAYMDDISLREGVVDEVKSVSDTMQNQYKVGYNLYDENAKNVLLIPDLVKKILPKYSLENFGSAEATAVYRQLAEYISPRKQTNSKTGEVKIVPVNMRWLQHGEQFLNSTITQLYKEQKPMVAEEVENILKQYKDNIAKVIPEYQQRVVPEARSSLNTAQKEFDKAMEGKGDYDTVKAQAEADVPVKEAEKEAVLAEEEKLAGEIAGDISSRVLNRPALGTLPAETPAEKVAGLGKTSRIVDDRPKSVGVNISDVLGKEPANYATPGKPSLGVEPSVDVNAPLADRTTTPVDTVLGGNKAIADLSESTAAKTADIDAEIDKLMAPIIAKENLDQAGVDLEAAKKLFRFLKIASFGKKWGDKEFKEFIEVFPRGKKLSKIVERMDAGNDSAEIISEALFAANARPRLGDEVATAIKSNPALKEKVAEYIVFRTFMNRKNEFLSGEAIKNNWNVVGTKAAKEVLGEDRFNLLDAYVKGLSEIDLVKPGDSSRAGSSDIFKRVSERIANRAPSIYARLTGLISAGFRDYFKELKTKEELQRYLVATMLNWKNAPTSVGEPQVVSRLGRMGFAATTSNAPNKESSDGDYDN